MVSVVETENQPNKSTQCSYRDKKFITDWTDFLDKELKCFKLYYEEGHVRSDGSLNNFTLIKMVGTGAYSRVFLSLFKKTSKPCAIKILVKKKIVKSRQIQNIKNEKRILRSLKFTFIINLYFAFKDNSNLYFVMPFIEGGELFDYLREEEFLNENEATFYCGQVVLALEYLHHLGLVFRDLKPENLLMDRHGYLKLADFGFCKLLLTGRTYSLCGTDDYLAPEVILQRGYNNAVDWWALGVLIYEICAGYPPFPEENITTKYLDICKANYSMLSSFSVELKDLIRNLLQTDLTRRLGNLKSGADGIKKHMWFKKINWILLLNRKVEPPHIPRTISIKRERSDGSRPKIYISNKEEYPKEFEDF